MGFGVELSDHMSFSSARRGSQYNTTGDSPKTHYVILALQTHKLHACSTCISGWEEKGRHPFISVKQSKTCPLCCDRSPYAPAHSRFGYRQSWCCSEQRQEPRDGRRIQREKKYSDHIIRVVYIQCVANYSH